MDPNCFVPLELNGVIDVGVVALDPCTCGRPARPEMLAAVALQLRPLARLKARPGQATRRQAHARGELCDYEGCRTCYGAPAV
jgi:hypothetical protein